jgi:hypothetical protein
MPTKQTREEIEAELNASETGRVVHKLRALLVDHDEFEKGLQDLEAQHGLPEFYRSKTIVERMAAVGYDQAAIDHVKTWLDALNKIVSGRQDELPDHVKNELAADTDAELSGVELLADIVQSHRKA